MESGIVKRSLIQALPVVALCFSAVAWGSEDQTSLAVYQPVLSEEFKEMLRNGDLAKGENQFMRKCSSCHDDKKDGGNGKGPHLWNVMGRKAGTYPGFEYSDAMRNSGHVWNYATLNYYLTRTDRAVPGRIMDFRGIRKDSQRADLLLFMRTLNDNPLPLPE